MTQFYYSSGKETLLKLLFLIFVDIKAPTGNVWKKKLVAQCLFFSVNLASSSSKTLVIIVLFYLLIPAASLIRFHTSLDLFPAALIHFS